MEKGKQSTEAEALTRLIERIQDGSSGAFVELSELYAPLLEAEVARYVGSLSETDLEDLREAALISLYRAALAYRADRGVTFGLFAKICIVNGIADTLRYLNKKGQALSVEDLPEEAFPVGDDNPQSRVLDREALDVTRKKIRSVLSDFEYSVFQLYIAGYSYTEIAVRMGKSAKSIDNALCRIKIKLRKNL